ncbi:MAG TPA: Stp1/IreP family PP2C-type Ser/Thr phosphatase [Gaiellaceae bacterium]|nr:Stp1/IreP family PP2C-type Ser/Thr phosphatase [Gaiellaceae bacterium]
MTRLGRFAAKTDPGRKRRGNEDAFVCKPPLFAIADGMGGAQAGEVASALAADALRERPEGANVTDLIQEANRRVHNRASTDASTSGMGTTITAAIVEDDGTIIFGHVGDSRAYLLREDRLEQVTNDHSLVAELVRRGELSPAEAEVHPQRSVITRALGTDPNIDVDTFAIEAKPGDLYLICSDGLSDMVDGGDIEVILRTHRSNLDEAARALIQAANRAGGEDNITAVLFETVGDEEPDETTREYSGPAAVPGQETATLHPEDHVTPPPPAPAADDTMVVRVEQLTAEEEAEEEFEAGIGRRMLALAVIIALCVLIVVLVWWGLAR